MEILKSFDKQAIFKLAKQYESPESLLTKDICVVRERSWNGDNVYLATKNIEGAEKFLNEVDGLSSIEYSSVLNEYTRGRVNKKVSSDRVISFRLILGHWCAKVENLDTTDIDIQIVSLIEVVKVYEDIVNKLKSNEVLILYKRAEGYKVIHTSLNQLTISKWLNTSSLYEVMQVIKRFDNPNNIAEIVVPNLDTMELSYERINVLDILKIELLDK